MLRGVSQSFRDRADSAAFYEAWVGAVLARKGLHTVHMPFEIDGKDHSQSYDLSVFHKDQCDQIKVEVKAVKLTFNGIEDYPFNEVLVCSHNSFKNKWPNEDTVGRDFLLVSQVTGHIVWVPIGTPVHIKPVTDRGRDEKYDVCCCDKKDLKSLSDFVWEVTRK